MSAFLINRERKSKALTDDELDTVFKALFTGRIKETESPQWFNKRTAIGRRNHGLLLVMLATGCRSVSLTRLLVGDVAVSDEGVGFQIQNKKKPLAKNAHISTVWVSGNFVEPLKKFLDRRPGGRKPSDPLFCAFDSHGQPIKDKPITQPAIQPVVRRFSNSLGFKDHRGDRLTSHRFRHTLATKMGSSGANVVELCQQFGWTSAKMADVYLDFSGRSNAWALINKD